MDEQPHTWEQCAKLLRSPDLDDQLKVKLVQLAFGGHPAVAVKAIEMLLQLPRVARDDFLDVPTADLLKAEATAEGWLKRIGGDGAGADEPNR